MGVKLAVLSIFLFLVSIGLVSAVACADLPNFQELIGGAPPDSALGMGAVDICNVCYPCGADDGVCPEDFYSDAGGRGSCRFFPDPDCTVLVNGTVEDSDGVGVENAEIIALYEPDIKETVTTTNSQGNYVGSVRTGFIKMYVSYQDYDSRIVSVDIPRASSTDVVETVDFLGGTAIEPGSCSPQCTDNFGTRCKASCDGINGCQFENFTVSTLCDDKIAGSRVFLSDDTYLVCCQGNEVYSTNDNRVTADSSTTGQLRDGGASNLVTFTQRVRSYGERVSLQVAVWASR